MEKERQKKKKRQETQDELKASEGYRDKMVTDEELIRWMTEGTHPNMIPRSDGG